MTFSDDLLSVLKLGWDSTRRAWQILTPDAPESPPELLGATGRALDQFAYDLRRLGHGKPARLAYSTAFVLNGLANQTIQRDQELLTRASQIVSILAEMMFELEASSAITAEEPIEAVEHLRVQWGLAEFDESSAPLTAPAISAAPPASAYSAALVATSNKLVAVSERLLTDVQKDDLCPYAAAISQILHLSTTVRDAIDPAPAIEVSGPAVCDARDNCSGVSEEVASEPARELSREADRPRPDGPQILVIEESPFIRTVLQSALESSGYTVRAYAGLAELASQTPRRVELTICDVQALNGDLESLRRVVGTGVALALSNGVGEHHSPVAEIPVLRRTDLGSLLSAVAARVKPARPHGREPAEAA